MNLSLLAALIHLQQENRRLTSENELLKARLQALEEAVAKLIEKEKKPPAFVKANKKTAGSTKPRKKRAAKDNKARRRETPTKFETHRLETCPTCGEGLQGHKARYSRQIIDIPEPAPIEVIEHTIEAGWCKGCRRWHLPPREWEKAIGKGRMGVRLTGLVGYLRSLLRLPYRQIQALLLTLYRVKLSVGEIVNLSRRVEQKLEAEVSAIKEEARGSPVVHMDETGWRENGRNGYIWCMVTDTPRPIRYFEYHQSRAGVIVSQMLGDQFSGILATDFYAGYNIYLGQHQRCWVHLLRDLKKLKEEYGEDDSVLIWCVSVANLYYAARQFDQSSPTAAQRCAMEPRLSEMTRQLGVMYAQTDHPCRTLAKRIIRHMDELYLFVRQVDVKADNNLAERAIRPVVVQRKISGGSRSSAGSQTVMRLATLFQTWAARGENPLHECWRLLGYGPIWGISTQV